MTALRQATAADAGAVAALHTASWRTAYVAELPADFLAQLDAAEGARGWARRLAAGALVLLADGDEELAGFCGCGPSRDADAAAGGVWEIYALHVRPDLKRGGIGGRLLDAAREAGVERGAGELTLWVVRTNTPARTFYERKGMRVDGAEQRRELGPGAALDEVRYRLAL